MIGNLSKKYNPFVQIAKKLTYNNNKFKHNNNNCSNNNSNNNNSLLVSTTNINKLFLIKIYSKLFNLWNRNNNNSRVNCKCSTISIKNLQRSSHQTTPNPNHNNRNSNNNNNNTLNINNIINNNSSNNKCNNRLLIHLHRYQFKLVAPLLREFQKLTNRTSPPKQLTRTWNKRLPVIWPRINLRSRLNSRSCQQILIQLLTNRDRIHPT